MFTIKSSQKENLPELAICHMACFPASLATKLGFKYVQKTLEWFLVNPNRFLFHITEEGKVIGYCGGFIPQKWGDGSSSGMLQYAFKQAIFGIITKPFLLFHPEVSQNYPFLWLNLKRKITGKAKLAKPVDEAKPFQRFAGLVVIGVSPERRGQGIAQKLMAAFETKTREFNQTEMVLSVKKDNGRAIKAYTKFGWNTREELGNTYVMHKFI